MMLTTASQLPVTARCATVSALGAIGPSSAALIRHRQQQARGFRFGRIWSSNLDSEFHRDICRRHRKNRYKYAEALNKRLLGDKHPLGDDAKATFRRMIHDYWYPMKGPRSCGRYANQHRHWTTPDNPTGVRPGQNIEDAERGPMAHFLFGDRDQYGFPFQRTSPKTTGSDTAQEEYIIDPITNRKRPRASSTLFDSGPGKKTYKSAHDSQMPIFYDGPPPEAELEKYSQVSLDPKPWNPIQVQITADQKAATTPDRQPILQSDEYVQNHLKSANPSTSTQGEDGSPSWSHKSISWHRSDGIVPPSIESWSLSSELFGYKDLDKYKPVMHNENTASQTSVPKYDDLQKYEPVMVDECEANEPEPSQPYEDLEKYDAFRYQEPDGKPLANEQEQSPELEKYQPFRHNEPDGKLASYEEPGVDPAELAKYQAFRYNEPDGRPPATAEEGNSYDYAELEKYGPVRYNEPDGKSPAVDEAEGCDPAELEKYQPFMYNEPDGKSPVVDEAEECNPAELQKYQPFMYNEPDGKPPGYVEEGNVYDPKESQQYGPFMYNEPDGKMPTAQSEIPDPAELNKYGAVRWNEPDGKPAEEADPITQSLEEFELSSPEGQQPSIPVFCRTYPAAYVSERERAEDLDLLRASDVRAAAGIVQSSGEGVGEKADLRNKLESSMTRHTTSSDAIDSQTLSALKESKLKTALPDHQQKGELTGEYIRDFPEEFARSWGVNAGSSSLEREMQKAEREQVEEWASFDQSQPLQPALDRQLGRSQRLLRQETLLDPYSKEPQGLETSYAQECAGQSTWPTYVKNYGSVDAKADSAADGAQANMPRSADTAMPEPTLYKVLAYDPTMQTINIAETASVVPDSTPPLTPAEVLLRLSNPAKFFPHFGPLQAQGFEIVSGSGDVLVFRKVRAATAESVQQKASMETVAATATAAAAADTTTSSVPPVNPIDMTGVPREFLSPVTSRFASPTGFVNYDFPPLSETQSDTRSQFLSGIDVRREEPVFSGSRPEQEQRTKWKMPKRIAVGAAWVAGISYSLGVIGEYFKTGGADGKGPRGL